jgi:purine catabolism regulator
MPLTVEDLLALPGLGLSVVAGRDGLDRPIRWAHTSELADPTRWLSGNELLLTTGLALKASPNLQRAYLNRLVDAGLAGLGFGLGFGFDAVPAPILRAADRAAFPVLEVPYPVPFIAITEAVSSVLTKERMRELETSEAVHDRLAQLVGAGSGPGDVLEEVVELAPGWIYLFDLKGAVLASSSTATLEPPTAPEVWKRLPPGLVDGTGATTSSTIGPSGSLVALPVDTGKRHEGIVAFGKPGRVEVGDRVVVRHAVTLLGLLLAARRAVSDVERRVAGDLLVEAVEGHVGGPQLERRLELAGFSPGAPVCIMLMDLSRCEAADPEAATTLLDAALDASAERSRAALVAKCPVALVVAPEPDVIAKHTLARLVATYPALEDARIAVGEAVELRELRRSYVSAKLALRAAPPSIDVVTPNDLGAYSLLMTNQPRAVLESFVGSILGAIVERDGDRGSDLLPSVRAFVEAGGRWEEGAQILGIHRHTLRYRINQAQELIARDLFSAEDRMEIWLACKALDLLEDQG